MTHRAARRTRASARSTAARAEEGSAWRASAHPWVLAGVPTQDKGMQSLYGMTVVNGFLYGSNGYRKGGLVYKAPTEGGALS